MRTYEQIWWRKVFEELRSPPKGQRALTLHRPGEGEVFRADTFHDDLVPQAYRFNVIELNPNRPETINIFRNPSARTFLWGGNGHWRCLVKNQHGGIDLLNDSTVTRNYFSSVGKMIDHFK